MFVNLMEEKKWVIKTTIQVLSKESFRKSNCHRNAQHVTGSITVKG